MRMSPLVRGAAVVGLLALGCSGLFGYGNELGETNAATGKPFKLDFTASKEDGASHKVWLEYAVDHTQNFQVTGSFELKRGKQTVDSWTMNLKADGSPVGGGRISLNKKSTNFNGKGSTSETVKLVNLPDLKKGEKLRITGRFQPGPGTTLKKARLVVTD